MEEVLWKTALVDPKTAREMAEATGIPVRVARWLCVRGIAADEAKQWLQPDSRCWSSPSVFTDMNLAVDRILKAVRSKERIAIVGDYDVDGVTASSILASALMNLEADWICDIPHRVNDGYGLSKEIVMRLKERGVDLLVTVDNGIRSLEAVAAAKELEMEVIITDHHEPGDEVPDAAAALVHWSRTNLLTDISHLSGAGVALKLSEALLAAGEENGIVSPDGTESLIPWLKGLASLGALADVMPVTPENRLLIREGLTALQSSKRPGWQSLCRTAGVKMGELTDKTVLWRITPRLNAAGRMDSARLAFQLLMSTDGMEAERIAQEIEALNSKRRAETDKAFKAAKAQCEALSETNPPGYVAAGPWPQGVVGIVAARLVDVYHKPVIVLADAGDGTMKGSGRSPEGTSLYQAAEQCQQHLTHFGGHDGAIGCGLHSDAFAAFQGAFIEACEALEQSPEGGADGDGEAFEQKLMAADDFLPLAEVNLETAGFVELFAPYGPGNPPLCFYVGPLAVEDISMVGNANQHARLRVSESGVSQDMIWFNAPEWVRELEPGTSMSAVAEIEVNTFRGNRRAQLRIVDGKRLNRPLTRQHFGALYKMLRARRKLLVEDAAEVLPNAMTDEVRVILDAFVELGFARCRESAYHVVEHAHVRDLRESRHYHDHLQQAICL